VAAHFVADHFVAFISSQDHFVAAHFIDCSFCRRFISSPLISLQAFRRIHFVPFISSQIILRGSPN